MLAEVQPEPEARPWALRPGRYDPAAESPGREVRVTRSVEKPAWEEMLGEAELGRDGKAEGSGDNRLLRRDRQREQLPRLEGRC